MKRLFSTLLILSFITTVFSQEKGTHDLSISVGGITNNDFLNIVSEIVVTGVSAGSESYVNSKSTPSIAITYKNALMDNWFLYGDVVYQSFKKDILLSGVAAGSLNNIFLTFGLGSEYHYVHGEWFQMYSGLSLAYTNQYSNYTGNSSEIKDGSGGNFNYQINALGFRVGKSLAGFAELGIGYKGVASIGISYQF